MKMTNGLTKEQVKANIEKEKKRDQYKLIVERNYYQAYPDDQKPIRDPRRYYGVY